MFRTTTEAPPMNLVTSWLKWLTVTCKYSSYRKQVIKKIEVTRYFGRASARTKAATKWVKNTEKAAKKKG